MKMIAIPGKNYQIGETVVTQGQWREVMDTEPWKDQPYVMEGDDYPAVYVSWHDAVEFCKKLSDIEGKAYRLPTEAEWEYACRGGAATKYYFGDDAASLGEYAWFHENTWSVNEKYAHRVAQKRPNQFGLYDMHGNVWEWCNDWYDKNQEYRVLRGGSWSEYSVGCSAWCRIHYSPELRFNYIGFRLVISYLLLEIYYVD